MLYHATTIKNSSKILNEGIKPKNNEIYLSPTIQDAIYAVSQWHGDKEFAVFKVNIENMSFDNVESDSDNVRLITSKIIPPNRIKLIGKMDRM